MITLEQIKGARAMLNMSQAQLAAKAGIGIATLNNIERGAQTDPKLSTLTSIQQALEAEGIEFINETPGSIGLRLMSKTARMRQATILIVDDNKNDRMLYKTWLNKMPNTNYRIHEAETAKAGLDAFVAHTPDCIILDFMLYGADGFQLLASLKQEHAKLPPIIFITGMHHEALEQRAQSHGVYAFLQKQKLTQEALCKTVADACAKRA